MNIILVEERGGTQLEEQSFSKGVIVFGRDSFECDVAFDNTQFPMVSRKHAELRWQDGKWSLVDLGSSFGTFLNGQKLAGPQEVSVGNALQFGLDGPVMRVVWFEVVADSGYGQRPAEPAYPAFPRQGGGQEFEAVPRQEAAKPFAPVPPPPKPLVPAHLVFAGGDMRTPFVIPKNGLWIGRDPECAIVFDSSSATVSRRHAEIRVEVSDYVIHDNNSFNGTLVNGQRISTPVPLYHKDEIQFGMGGPIVIFESPLRVAPEGASLTGQRSVQSSLSASINIPLEAVSPKTVVLSLGEKPGRQQVSDEQPQLLMSIGFGDKNTLKIGRHESNDIRLDGLQISKFHARLTRSGPGVSIEDLNSTNGVHVNGARISKQVLRPEDSAQVGTFLLRVDSAGNVGVFDTRAKTRIDVVSVTREVKNRAGRGKIKLLDTISLSIKPNEFVGFLGPSGAGKSTLIEAMNGMRPATSGNVMINDIDLYRHLDTFKHTIGYVPQEDIIHRELSVYRTLYYVAKLRLSRDVSRKEIDQIINEVLDVTGLAESRNIPVRELSGGQRKRVSIAVELITKPSVIYLDEPTSGLDPATEDKIMRLFKQIAESGRTIVMTTHAMENVKLFDKIVVLMRGKLAFYGTPEDALKHLHAASYKELFDKLEAPVREGVKQHGEANRANLTDRTAEEWRQKFLRTPQYKQLVHDPLSELGKLQKTGVRKRRRLGLFGAIGQWITLSRRYVEVLLKDKFNLAILLLQAPIIALMTFLVMGANQPRDFLYFVLSLVAVWFGTSVAAREIVREQPVYKRERMFNLGILPYLASKLFILGLIVFLQCLLLFVPLKFFDLIGLMPMPGELGGLPQLSAMLVTAAVGVALGLLVSALVRTSEMATSLVPLLLIPQLLFSGLTGVPSGINKVVGLTMPAAWAFDTMKRFSTLDTLEPEGANPKGKTKGLGLIKSIEAENEKILEDAKRDLEDYKKISGGGQYQDDASTSNSGNTLADKLEVPEMKKIPEDLSGYVTFLHPWMGDVLNQLVLMLMFWMLVIITLIVLKLKDLV